MKKLIVALAFAGIVSSAGPAFAKSFTGVVEAIDRDRGLVMMEDGTEFIIPDGVRVGSFQPGAEVTVRFKSDEGENTLKSMRKADPKEEDDGFGDEN